MQPLLVCVGGAGTPNRHCWVQALHLFPLAGGGEGGGEAFFQGHPLLPWSRPGGMVCVLSSIWARATLGSEEARAPRGRPTERHPTHVLGAHHPSERRGE